MSAFSKDKYPLRGIANTGRLDCFVMQLIDSMRRIYFVELVEQSGISDSRANPKSEYFDPIRAAIIHREKGDINEAFWLIFFFW